MTMTILFNRAMNHIDFGDRGGSRLYISRCATVARSRLAAGLSFETLEDVQMHLDDSPRKTCKNCAKALEDEIKAEEAFQDRLKASMQPATEAHDLGYVHLVDERQTAAQAPVKVYELTVNGHRTDGTAKTEIISQKEGLEEINHMMMMHGRIKVARMSRISRTDYHIVYRNGDVVTLKLVDAPKPEAEGQSGRWSMPPAPRTATPSRRPLLTDGPMMPDPASDAMVAGALDAYIAQYGRGAEHIKPLTPPTREEAEALLDSVAPLLDEIKGAVRDGWNGGTH